MLQLTSAGVRVATAGVPGAQVLQLLCESGRLRRGREAVGFLQLGQGCIIRLAIVTSSGAEAAIMLPVETSVIDSNWDSARQRT